MNNPYLITGPALISFSGGRTSGYMLHQILQAHGGKLPPNVAVAFANTGKEREETLRFVYECGQRWNVSIAWLEWRDTRRAYINKEIAVPETFEVVGYNSAARNGEPFEALINMKQRLPNSFERWCTQYLKVNCLTAYAGQVLGCNPGQYAEVIGIRADEPVRLENGRARKIVDGRDLRWPLADAGVTKADVMDFWRQQDFDLGLEPWEGNCDFCFMKGKGIRKRILRDTPALSSWWNQQEINQDGWFDKRDTVRELQEQVRTTPSFFDGFEPADYDVECGLTCSGGHAA